MMIRMNLSLLASWSVLRKLYNGHILSGRAYENIFLWKLKPKQVTRKLYLAILKQQHYATEIDKLESISQITRWRMSMINPYIIHMEI